MGAPARNVRQPTQAARTRPEVPARKIAAPRRPAKSPASRAVESGVWGG